MFERHITPLIKRYAKIYPIIALTGPRQSGKTTLAQHIFSDLPYVSLENLDEREHANQDPRGFLANYKNGAIFDEVQNCPELFSYLQGVADQSKKNGKYILTGSQNFLLNQQITQSLAGRVGMATLLPLSLSELPPLRAQKHIFQGGYPRLYKAKMRAFEFFPSYIQTYLERDIRSLKNIVDLSLFQKFLKLCAGRVGQLLNYSSLANDCGIATTTARSWMSLLEASYIIHLLPPYHNNFNKRLVKMPKLYFYDTGLACSLLGLEEEKQLDTHYLKGNLFENAVIIEVLKARYNQGKSLNLYFWRDHTGHEIDLIGEWGGTLHAIEIKSTATFKSELLKPLNYFMDLTKTTSEMSVKGTLIYNAKDEAIYKNVKLIPLQKAGMWSKL